MPPQLDNNLKIFRLTKKINEYNSCYFMITMDLDRRALLRMSGTAVAASLGGCLEQLREGDVQRQPDTGYDPENIDTTYSEIAGQESEFYGDYLNVEDVPVENARMEESSFTGHDLYIHDGGSAYTEPINIYGIEKDGLNLNVFEFTEEPQLKDVLESNETKRAELEGNGSRMTVNTNQMTKAGNYGLLVRDVHSS